MDKLFNILSSIHCTLQKLISGVNTNDNKEYNRLENKYIQGDGKSITIPPGKYHSVTIAQTGGSINIKIGNHPLIEYPPQFLGLSFQVSTVTKQEIIVQTVGKNCFLSIIYNYE